MKKYILLVPFLFLINVIISFGAGFPRICVKEEDRGKIVEKIHSEPWAATVYKNIKDKVDPYVDRHVSDPEWIVSRLAMYWKEGERYTQCYLKKQNWDRGEGNAPVPTVRMPGMRTWNKYVNVPLEQRKPYNESGDMLALDKTNPGGAAVLVPYKESGHLIRNNNSQILEIAGNAAFIYWISGDEKYARFAGDIFNTWLIGTYYMNPILDPDKSCGSSGGWEPGGICGYYDYEQIHDDLVFHASPIYDFMFAYLNSHPHPQTVKVGKTTETLADIVFKRFIELGFIRGGKSGNWNVNGWNMILRPIMVLKENNAYPDGKGREYYLHYLVKESTPYHDAIPDILKSYDPVTGLWPEAPGYSFGTIDMLLNFATMLRNAGIDIIADNPILQKAALAVFPWMDEQANMVAFGDSRGGTASFNTFENLLTYYTQKGDSVNMNLVSAGLNKVINQGKYKRERSGWMELCTFINEIPQGNVSPNIRMAYSPHHRFITMKNFYGSNKLMANLYGGTNGSHLTPNGLALQLYGFGWALSPDAAGYESYWSADHKYHQSPTGSNTILPGYMAGDIHIRAMEPFVGKNEFYNSGEMNPDINFADISADEKRRIVALVKTGENTGFYVDIFRSDLENNDYIFHNLGNRMVIKDSKGETLPLAGVNDLGTEYHMGYSYFKNQQKIFWNKDFQVSWTISDVTPSISMNMWMVGQSGRELYKVDAPYTTITPGITPGNVCMPPNITPTLIVRQKDNNASLSPFIAVFEPITGDMGNIVSVKDFSGKEGVAGICISSRNDRTDYVFSADCGKKIKLRKNVEFDGTFGWVSMQGNELQSLYIGNGKLITSGKFKIESSEKVYATVYRKEGRWFYSSDGVIIFTVGGKSVKLTPGFNKILSDNIEIQ